MLYAQHVDCIYTHTEGEPTCIVHSGVPYPEGLDIMQKRLYLEKNYDWLRTALMREPRGHQNMFGVFVTPPSRADTDAGMIWMDGQRFIDMCGHGTIALSIVLASHGLVRGSGDSTVIRYETTAGLVTAEVAKDEAGQATTRFENVPAFVVEQDVPLELPGIGQVLADVAFGGNFFAIVKWDSSVCRIHPDNGSKLSAIGLAVKQQVNEKVKVRHPVQTHIQDINFVTFYHEPELPDSMYKNVHVFSDGKLDRSPGGTGTSAMMAMFQARGMLALGETIRSEGLLGSGRFEGKFVSQTKVGEYDAVVPSIKGTAKLLGYAKWLVDPRDPVNLGFTIH